MGRRSIIVVFALMILIVIPGVSNHLYGLEGTLTYFTGDITVKRDGESIHGEIGMQIKEGDEIRTGKNATAVISVDDATDLKLRENTVLNMESISDTVSLELGSGGIFSRVRKKFFRSYSIRTETVLAGVRGTEFFIAYGRLIDTLPDVWICVNTGSIEVAVIDKEEKTIIREGEGINIIGGEKLSAPKKYRWTKQLNWNMNPEIGDVEDRTDLNQAYSDLLDQDYD
jgi:hypothetical protein